VTLVTFGGEEWLNRALKSIRCDRLRNRFNGRPRSAGFRGGCGVGRGALSREYRNPERAQRY